MHLKRGSFNDDHFISCAGTDAVFNQPDFEIARMVFRARVGVYDIKENFKKRYDGELSCPLCRQFPEQFEHIFQCNSGILCKKPLGWTTLYDFISTKDIQKTKKTGKFLVKYQKYREIFSCSL